jgi:hypothetical protein
MNPAGKSRLTKTQEPWVTIDVETVFKRIASLKELCEELDLVEAKFRAWLDGGDDLEVAKRYSAIDALWAVLSFFYSSLPKYDPVTLQRLHAELITAAERDEGRNERSGIEIQSRKGGRPPQAEVETNVLSAKVCIAAAVDALIAKTKIEDGRALTVEIAAAAVAKKIPRRLRVRIQSTVIEAITVKKWVDRFRAEAKQETTSGQFYQHLRANIKRKARASKSSSSWPALDVQTYFDFAEELIEDLRHPYAGGLMDFIGGRFASLS